MKLALVLAALVLASPAFGQQAVQEKLKLVQGDKAALRAAIDAGKKAAFFCANCHGEDGNSKAPEVPNLAGQNPGYLLEQIRKFGVGERKDAFMQGVIKLLKEDERMQIALYFSDGTVHPGKADPALAARGQELFAKLCGRCHGEQARGNDANLIPRLAGQKPEYLKKSIARYRDKTGERNNPLMAAATSALKNEDIVAIANYLAQLP